MRSTSFRWGALLAAGVLAVHEARYRLLGADADGQAASAGHGYLGALTAIVGVALVLALGRYLHLWFGRQVEAPAACGRPLIQWALASIAVLAGYIGQELVAGWLATGHPAGVAGLLAHGGWVAVPLSLVAGCAISLLFRMAAETLRRRATCAAAPIRTVEVRRFPTTAAAIVGGRELARHLAGRAPPSPLSR